MKELRTEITINAPVQTVWEILTDFEKYPGWNPFIRSLEGDVKEGHKFKVIIQPPGSRAMTFKPVCLEYSSNRSFRWLGHLFIPGLFDGEHIFELIELKDGSTKFVQREHFKGVLVLLLWKQLNTNTRKGFEAMNRKLKELAEESAPVNKPV